MNLLPEEYPERAELLLIQYFTPKPEQMQALLTTQSMTTSSLIPPDIAVRDFDPIDELHQILSEQYDQDEKDPLRRIAVGVLLINLIAPIGCPLFPMHEIPSIKRFNEREFPANIRFELFDPELIHFILDLITVAREVEDVSSENLSQYNICERAMTTAL